MKTKKEKKPIFIFGKTKIEDAPFKKGDVVTYVVTDDKKNVLVRDILLFDELLRLNNTIQAFAKVESVESWQSLKLGNEAEREWEDGAKLRWAKDYEVRALLKAICKHFNITP